MYYHIFITGCQYNYYDSQNIAHLLSKMGYVYVADEKKADVIIVMACSVRQKPIDRIYGKLKIWKKLPQKPKIIITACLIPSDKKKLADRVDAIIKIDNINKDLPKILDNKYSNNYELKAKSCMYKFYPSDAQPSTAFIPIMQGCDNFCTYCAVPYTRGRERSRLEKEIISEIKSELKKGKKHIILLGQNVNSYMKTQEHENIKTLKHKNTRIKKQSFVELLKKIDKVVGEFDFNFMSSNPHDFSGELVNTLPKLKKWQQTLHLPFQSGDDKILKAMNRKYTAKQYLDLILNLKSEILNLKLTTDLIVGFPGETKKQFQNTYNLCKKIGFQKAFVSQYSPRPGTPAAKLDDDVSREEKKRRWKTLNDLVNKKTIY